MVSTEGNKLINTYINNDRMSERMDERKILKNE